MTWHVLQINDIKEHEEASTCQCDPKVMHEDGDMIIVHNSYDGRELFEEINRYLNKDK